jgi:hypothetical protein
MYNYDGGITSILNATFVSGGFIFLSYVSNAYDASNQAANTQECYKVDKWHVYSDRKPEHASKVADSLSYEEARNLLDKLPTTGGLEPQAVSSKSYGGLFPKIDRNGEFIGFYLDESKDNLPFQV